MFEKHRQKRAQQQHEAALAVWQGEVDAHKHLAELADRFAGVDTNEIMLANGERLFFKVRNVSLIEDRVRGGHWEGRSSGVSIPVGSIGGRTVRYRVGKSRGHYVQGAPTPTAIDTGTVYITSKRVIFQGSKQTRECSFSKLIGVQHDEVRGATTISVSNRQKPTTIFYGPAVAGAFDFRLDLALAHFEGTVSEFAAQVRQQLAQLEGERPAAPVAIPG